MTYKKQENSKIYLNKIKCNLYAVKYVYFSLFFLINSSNLLIVTSTQSSMLSSPLPPFLTHRVYLSSQRCRALSIIIYFLVFWSILSILRIALSILKGRLSSCWSLWWDFCFRVWFREVFCSSALFSYFFLHHCLTVSASNIPRYC